MTQPNLMNNKPQHIAIIMDGNGRWAQQRGLSRSAGHQAGVEALDRTLRAVIEQGIPYLTVYAFSTENWHRPTEEVDNIMHLLAQGLVEYTPQFIANGIRLKAIGDLSKLPPTIERQLQTTIAETSQHYTTTLVIALSYSSYTELSQAIRRIVADVQTGIRDAQDLLQEDLIQSYLYTAEIPEPDLLIRTGGEQRLSNFLLLQSAYTELYFTDVLWPDFSAQDLSDAIADYSHRQRRFGKVPQGTDTTTSIDPHSI